MRWAGFEDLLGGGVLLVLLLHETMAGGSYRLEGGKYLIGRRRLLVCWAEGGSLYVEVDKGRRVFGISAEGFEEADFHGEGFGGVGFEGAAEAVEGFHAFEEAGLGFGFGDGAEGFGGFGEVEAGGA